MWNSRLQLVGDQEDRYSKVLADSESRQSAIFEQEERAKLSMRDLLEAAHAKLELGTD